MKDKYSYFKTNGEITGIDCSLLQGNIEVYGVSSGEPYVQKLRHAHVKISEKDGVLKIKQIRKPLFRKADVKIFIPAHCVPDAAFSLTQGKIKLENGIYRDLRIKAESVAAEIAHACFTNAEVACGTLSLNCADVSVKQLFAATADAGAAIMEDCLFTKLDLHFKDGDAGITQLKCRDSYFVVERGSISLNLKGAKTDYVLNLLSKNGTCNCENTQSGENSCTAYTEYGKIVVDFTESYREAVKE